MPRANRFITKVKADMEPRDRPLFRPVMYVPTRSKADEEAFKARFRDSARKAGVGNESVTVYQGQQGASELQELGMAIDNCGTPRNSERFAKSLYDIIKRRMEELSNTSGRVPWLFVYNPSAAWHTYFKEYLELGRLPETFCGYSDQLDTLVYFMVTIRELHAEQRSRGIVVPEVVFHLLVPTSTLLVIADPLVFPIEMGSFELEGTPPHSSLVYFNLPASETYRLQNIENLAPRIERGILGSSARAAAGAGTGETFADAGTAVSSGILRSAMGSSGMQPRTLGGEAVSTSTECSDDSDGSS